MVAEGTKDLQQLERFSRALRRDAIEAIYRAGSGHPGSALSTMDILVTLYIGSSTLGADSGGGTSSGSPRVESSGSPRAESRGGGILRHNPQQPDWKDRDYFLLSNGHASAGFYAVLAHCGYFPREELFKFRELGAGTQGHPKRGALPGVEISSGSLGQGLSVGLGLAQSLRLLGKKNRVFVMMSDGEQEEGSTWEAVMFGAKLKPNNLLAIVDKNGMQIDGPTAEVMPSLDPLGAKYQAFGWDVLEVDGHNFEMLFAEFSSALANVAKSRPTVVIAHTVRGHGVSFMENSPKWHAGRISDEEYTRAVQELTGDG